MKKYIKCYICDKLLCIENYIKHIKDEHTYIYQTPIDINNFKNELELKDNTLNELNCNEFVKEKQSTYQLKRHSINTLEPQNFKIETTTIWDFPCRGDWATHNGKYRGNWSPFIPRNVILRYSNVNDVVLDQFVGSGTTLIETQLLNRKGIGVDINPHAIKISKENNMFGYSSKYSPIIRKGDARNLNFIKTNSIDLICTHPPYANIIKYSNKINDDLSHLEVNEFLNEIKKVAKESYRVLKNNKYCAILMGDTRKNKHMIPLGFNVMQEFLNAGFILKETIIKQQHNCKTSSFWYEKSIDYNFLLIAHEYLFIFRKP